LGIIIIVIVLVFAIAFKKGYIKIEIDDEETADSIEQETDEKTENPKYDPYEETLDY
jgi:uncharacterized protein YpmB